jgi:hypothetical protein
MVFIIDLPASNGYISIEVIVDPFSTISYFILFKPEAKAPKLAKIFLKKIGNLMDCQWILFLIEIASLHHIFSIT